MLREKRDDYPTAHHRYIPRGLQTDTIKGSVKNGSGPIKQPNGGNNGGGQTDTSAGSTRPGGRAV